MRRAAALIAITLLPAGATACGDDDPVSSPVASAAAAVEITTTTTAPEPEPVVEPAVVDVVVPGGEAGEFSFATDLTSIPAGPVEVRLANGGALEHQAAIFRFEEGEDFGSFAAAAGAGGPEAALALVEGYGGPNAVAPGAAATTTQVLVPGQYALLCLIPDATGTPHAVQGMLRPFEVTEAEVPEPALAAADVEVGLVDLAFETDQELPAGATVRATNEGRQIHEIVAYRLEAGQSVVDVVDDVVAGSTPAKPSGGLGLVRPGGAADFRLPTEPGEYVFLCFVPDIGTEGGPPHLSRGMASQFRIE